MFHGFVLSTDVLFAFTKFVKSGKHSLVFYSNLQSHKSSSSNHFDRRCQQFSDAGGLLFTISPLKELGLLLRLSCLFICQNPLAEVLWRQEKYEAAEEMHRWALEGREKAQGLEHPFILASVNNLAGGRGKYEAAEDMDRRAREGRKKVLGFEHPEPSRGASRSGKV
jgi:Tetratricopeptide repeat